MNACSTFLRVTPMQFIKVKEALVAATAQMGYIRKREAQKICRIDVNKCGRIYEYFIEKRVIPGPPDGYMPY